MCHKGPLEGVAVQIHHINEDSSDCRMENLAVLCSECHRKLKDRLWMGRNYYKEEVAKYKKLWEASVRERRKHLAFPPAVIEEKVTEVEEKGVIKREIERKISYVNGLAPRALGISPKVPLSKQEEATLKEARDVVVSKRSPQKLLTILDTMKKVSEIKTEDMVVLSRICLSLGDSRFHADDFRAAETFYKEALRYAESASESEVVEICWYELGASIGMQNRHMEALECFDKAIALNRNNPAALYNKGVALQSLGEPSSAVEAYQKAIQTGTKASDWSTVASAHNNMGTALDELGKHNEAVEAYQKAIQTGTKAEKWSTVASAHNNMGTALTKLGKHNEAVEAYQKAIELRKFLPDSGERIFLSVTALICLLGTRSIKNKDYAKAKEFAKRLYQVSQNGRKDDMSRHIEKTMEEINSRLTQKEEVNALREFRRLFKEQETNS
jgi:tetratricopeptide (TPR) repeat protein